jgi:hypothetical protein
MDTRIRIPGLNFTFVVPLGYLDLTTFVLLHYRTFPGSGEMLREEESNLDATARPTADPLHWRAWDRLGGNGWKAPRLHYDPL